MANVTFNNLSKADGSALVEMDDTIVQATVFGPVDIAQSRINYEEAVVEILYKPKVSCPSTSPAFDQVREIENLLKHIYKEVIMTRLHPRTSISIYVQEIYGGDALLSTCINAVCLGLIDAGVPMKFPVAAVTIHLKDEVEQNGSQVSEEQQETTTSQSSRFDFVFTQQYELVTLLTRGKCINEDKLQNALTLGKDKAKETFDVFRQRVKNRFT